MEMLLRQMPGTALAYPVCDGQFVGLLSPVFTVTGGVFLSQLCELTGTESSAIQNWVKREFVSRPDGKKYNLRQAARIVLINALRTCMQIDRIISLLQYINGSLTDQSDDIIDDSELYDYFCTVVYKAGENRRCDDGFLSSCIANTLCDYSPSKGGDTAQLEKALLIMVKAYIAGCLKKEAEALQEALDASERT